jgi:hypothetical protein
MSLRSIVVPLLLVLTACSGGGSAAPTPTPTPSVLPGTSQDGFTGALEDVEGLDCRAAGEGWAFSGTVRNPTAEPADYRIYVALLDDAQQTRSVTQVTVDDLAAGEQRPWQGSADVDAEGLRCVLRVERVVG